MIRQNLQALNWLIIRLWIPKDKSSVYQPWTDWIYLMIRNTLTLHSSSNIHVWCGPQTYNKHHNTTLNTSWSIEYLEHGSRVQTKAVRPRLSDEGQGWWIIHCQQCFKTDITKRVCLSFWLCLVLAREKEERKLLLALTTIASLCILKLRHYKFEYTHNNLESIQQRRGVGQAAKFKLGGVILWYIAISTSAEEHLFNATIERVSQVLHRIHHHTAINCITWNK